MIRLYRDFTPIKLNPTFVARETVIFISTGKSVWNVDWLKRSLLDLSNNKCAFCECNLTEESKYMEVEHFEHKDQYPSKVLDWDNLLPACKRCNGSKGTHDVISEPIINPFVDTPSDHLVFRNFKLRGKDVKGKTTIDALKLNHTERVVLKRFYIGTALESLIENAEERLLEFELSKTAIRTNKLKGIIEDILNECQNNSIYCATCATILHTNDTYSEIKKRMQVHGLWDANLDLLDKSSKFYKL
jgi:uncharacterized protein (TIGR02646 family)